MEKVIQPIDRDLIKRELTPEKFIGKTRKGDNFILGVAMKFREQNPWMITSDNIFAITSERVSIRSEVISGLC